MEGRKVYYNLVSAAAEEVWLFFNERVTVSGPIIHRTCLYFKVRVASQKRENFFTRNEINKNVHVFFYSLSDIIRIGFSTDYEYALYFVNQLFSPKQKYC